MINYNNLLVIIDADTDTQVALSRAIELSEKTHASITALITVYDFSYDMTTMLSVDEREAMKNAVIRERKEWLLDYLRSKTSRHIDVIVEWSNRSFEAVIKACVAIDADIVLKSTYSHSGLRNLIFTPTDWHLIRKCPAPVLLVKEHDWPDNGNIIAAVNVGTEDKEHAQLNEKITTIAKDYSALLCGNLHLANSYPATPHHISVEIPDFDSESYSNSVKNHHLDEMAKHAQKHKISIERTHVEEGLPESVVPALATSLDAELVIIGTVGRVGISAALIGNTAEHVIDELHCDILAIKPDGFETPVKLQ